MNKLKNRFSSIGSTFSFYSIYFISCFFAHIALTTLISLIAPKSEAVENKLMLNNQCSILEITAKTTYEGHPFMKKGIGWLYKYNRKYNNNYNKSSNAQFKRDSELKSDIELKRDSELKIVAPNHVVDLGINVSNVNIEAQCGKKTYKLEVIGRSTLLDIAVLKVKELSKEMSDSIKPLLVLKDDQKVVESFHDWGNHPDYFGFNMRQGELFLQDLSPAAQPMYNPYYEIFKDLKPKYLEEFPQYSSVLIYPIVGVKFGTSGSPLFMSGSTLPVGMIMRTLPMESATMVLPLENIFSYLPELENGIDPVKSRFPDIGLVNILNVEANGNLSLQRQLSLQERGQKVYYTELCNNLKSVGSVGWSPVGGSWGDVSGSWGDVGGSWGDVTEVADLNTVGNEVNVSKQGNAGNVGSVERKGGSRKEADDESFFPKFQLLPNECDSDGLMELSNSGSKRLLVGVKNPLHFNQILKINTIDRMLEFIFRMNKWNSKPHSIESSKFLSISQLRENYLYSDQKLSTYDLICTHENFGNYPILRVEKEISLPEVVLPSRDKDNHYLMFKGSYFLKKEDAGSEKSPMQIRCDPKNKTITILSLTKVDQPLFIFSIKDNQVSGIFNFNANQMNSEEDWTFDSTDPYELVEKFLNMGSDENNFSFSKDHLWSIESENGKDYHFKLVFDSAVSGSVPLLTIEFSEIPKEQQQGMNFGFRDEGNLPLQFYQSKWFRE